MTAAEIEAEGIANAIDAEYALDEDDLTPPEGTTLFVHLMDWLSDVFNPNTTDDEYIDNFLWANEEFLRIWADEWRRRYIQNSAAAKRPPREDTYSYGMISRRILRYLDGYISFNDLLAFLLALRWVIYSLSLRKFNDHGSRGHDDDASGGAGIASGGTGIATA